MRRLLIPLTISLYLPILAGVASPPCEEGSYPGWNDCLGTAMVKGSTYKGEFRNGVPHGLGTMTFKSSVVEGGFNTFEGHWENGEYHGWGVFTFASGRKYVGEWRSGMRHGFGVVTSDDLDVRSHVGIWKNNVFVGEASLPQHLSDRVSDLLKSPLSTLRSDKSAVLHRDVVIQSLDSAKKKCSELGLKPGTERYGECVLRLTK